MISPNTKNNKRKFIVNVNVWNMSGLYTWNYIQLTERCEVTEPVILTTCTTLAQ